MSEGKYIDEEDLGGGGGKTIDNEDNAKRIFETMLAWREKQNLDLIDSLVLDGEIEWHKNFLNT